MSGEGHEATLVAGKLVGRESIPEDEIQQLMASFCQWRLEDSRKVKNHTQGLKGERPVVKCYEVVS